MELSINQLNRESFHNSDTTLSEKEANTSSDHIENEQPPPDIENKLSERCLQKISDSLHYCVLCNVCIYGKDNISAHTTGKGHKLKLSDLENDSQLRTKFSNNLNLHRKLYVQKGGGILCKLCHIIIKYEYLQSHIDGKVHSRELYFKQNFSTLPLCSDLTSTTDLPLYKYVSDDLMTKLKNADVEIVPASLQLIAENCFKCLICKVININAVSTHITNVTHQNKYQELNVRMILMNFHQYWKSSRYRKHQMFFFPISENSIECIVCGKKMSYGNVHRHCSKDTHKIKIIEGRFYNGISELQDSIFQIFSIELLGECIPNIFKTSLPPTPCDEQFYSDSILESIYAKEANRKHIMKIGNNSFYCLLCPFFNISRSILEVHTLSREHQAFLQNRYHTAMVHSFHVEWAKFPADLQLQQRYFSPSKNPNTFRCLCCKSPVRLTNVLEHVYGGKHNRYVEYFNRRYKLMDVFDMNSEGVRLKLYPESLYTLIKDFSDIDCQYKSIQRVSMTVYKCLFCRYHVTSIIGHVTEKSHKMLIENETLIDSVEKYHTHWNNINDDFQKYQIDFEPVDNLTMHCVTCKEDVLYNNLMDHLRNSHKTRNSESSPPNTPDNLLESKKPTSFVAFYPLRLLKTIQQYDGKMSRNVQMINNAHYRCLLCRINTNDLEFHLQTTDHKQQLSDTSLHTSVQFYHNLWDDLSNHWQHYQREFFPADEHSIMCIRCEQTIKNTDELLTHLTKYEDTQKFVLTCNMPRLQKLSKTQAELTKLNINSSSDDDDSSDSDSEQSDSNDEHSTTDVLVNRTDILRKVELDGLWRSLPSKFNFNKRYICWQNDELVCNLCTAKIVDFTRSEVMSHITSNAHQLNLKRNGDESMYWKRIKYECLRCKKMSYDEVSWQNHLASIRHKELIKQNSNDVFKENFCTQCTLVMFGTEENLKNHEHIKKKRKTKGLKIPPNVQEYLQTPEKLEIFVQKLFDEALQMTSKDLLGRACCDSLRQTVETFFPNCRVHPFGSRVSGLGCGYSDLDIFLDVGNMYDGMRQQSGEAQSNLVIAVLGLLKKHPEIWCNFEPIPQARTPILRVYHKPTKLDCDISFRHGLSKENTKLLSFYLTFQPIARKLILFLKFWITQLNFDQKFNSYALSMMVIFYLQTKKLLYSVSELKKMYPDRQKIIAGWECSFYSDIDNIKKIPCDYTFLELLADFFKYYTNFNYAKEVICPLLGWTVKKNDFHFTNENTKLPIEMKSYIDRIEDDYEAEYEPELFRSLSPLCVQDPFDLAHNLTKSIPGHSVIKFKKSCELSYELLKKHLNKQLENIN